LLKIAEIQTGLLTAAGVSDKATNHLQDSDKREAVKGLIKNFLEPAGANFVEELVFRFLLTRGDTLGGSMRNVGGFMAQKKLTRAILACLKLAGQKCHSLHAETNAWAVLPDDDADVELWLRGLSWVSGKGPRALLYNVTVPLIKNNVDLLLFGCSSCDLTREIIRTPSAYIALGELKGGIDPAGADEHWKTARTALNRIHEAFAKQKLKPHTFFIGAAIETKMASEIWAMLKRGIWKTPRTSRTKTTLLRSRVGFAAYELQNMTAAGLDAVLPATPIFPLRLNLRPKSEVSAFTGPRQEYQAAPDRRHRVRHAGPRRVGPRPPKELPV
jgi:hypothetical protein